MSDEPEFHYEVSNWDTYQNIKWTSTSIFTDEGTWVRPPKWIRLHRSVLSNYKILQLTLYEQCCLFKLWIVASEKAGRLYGDPGILASKLLTNKTKSFLRAISHIESLGLIKRVEGKIPVIPRRQALRKTRLASGLIVQRKETIQ